MESGVLHVQRYRKSNHSSKCMCVYGKSYIFLNMCISFSKAYSLVLVLEFCSRYICCPCGIVKFKHILRKKSSVDSRVGFLLQGMLLKASYS